MVNVVIMVVRIVILLDKFWKLLNILLKLIGLGVVMNFFLKDVK